MAKGNQKKGGSVKNLDLRIGEVKKVNDLIQVAVTVIANDLDGSILLNHPVKLFDPGLTEFNTTTGNSGIARRIFSFHKTICGKEISLHAQSQISGKLFHQTIPVAIPKFPELKITPKTNLDIMSGGEIQFYGVSGDEPVNMRWEIVSPAREKGEISQEGLYRAPEIVKNHLDVKIRGIDRNSGNQKTVKVPLVPIEMKARTQLPVHAGQNELQLAIESLNDPAGKNNFVCKIISVPLIGKVSDGGKFLPPRRIRNIVLIQVEATSSLDDTKKCVLDFELRFPLCPMCRTHETNANGDCTNCGHNIGPILKEKCPRCGSIRWTGKNCPSCSYPKRRTKINI